MSDIYTPLYDWADANQIRVGARPGKEMLLHCQPDTYRRLI